MGEVNWNQAQKAERLKHTMSIENAVEHYRASYYQYFKWLNIMPFLDGKMIAEVGPADVPALAFCIDTDNCFVVETMPSDILQTFGLFVVNQPAEDVDFSMCDEVWLFNVLQHVCDLEGVVKSVKRAKAVRWFEPVNQGTDECHLHNLTHDMFKDWFGVSNVYEANPNAVRFHTAECSYGYFQSAR